MFGIIFLGLLVSATFCVLLFGDKEQRQIQAVLVCAYLGTYVFFNIGIPSWLTIKFGIVILDCLAFVALTAIALRSKRFWPLWIASFQFMPLLTYAAAAYGQNLVSQALGVAQGLWGYLQLTILLIVAIRTRISAMKIKKSLPA
jgi:hypothetical protein